MDLALDLAPCLQTLVPKHRTGSRLHPPQIIVPLAMRMRALIPSTSRDWRTVAILAAVYFVVEKFGVALVFGHSGATPVWPPTGIALAALLVLGYRAWPGILLGAFLASVTGSGDVVVSAGVAAGNTLEGLAGAWLINRFAGGRRFFEQPSNVLKFTVIVGIVSLVSPPIGMVSLSLRNLAFWNNETASLGIWWLADMLSVFIVVPLLVVWSANARVRWSLRQGFEFTLLTVSLVLVGEAVFGRLAPDSAQGYLLPYLCLPFLIWAAFRFGSRETATLNFILTVIAIWGTLHGYGLFARTVQEKALLACQGYIIFNSVVSLAVAAVVAHRRRADEELHASFRYARSLLESSLDPLLTISPQGRITDVNKASELVTGLPREQLIGSNFSDHFTEPQKAETGYQKVLGEGQVRDYPLTIRHLSGRTTDVLYNATVYRNEAGTVQGVFAAARDITKRKEAERRLDFTNSLLALFAQKASAREYLDSAVDVIRRWSGSQALGIRIVDEHREIPYESWAGFEPGFLELENRLSLERDNCCCIRAVSAEFEDQDRALLTPAGSFRCDDSIAFINQLPPEKRARYRGNCMKFGFASLAIIPIRYRDVIIGAIHLADRRPGCFPPAIVEFIESMSPLIGEAIHRFQTEAELAKHRNQLEELVGQRTCELEASNLHLQKEIVQRADAEASLRQTAQDLERSNRDLEQFAYVASHDLQEPLRAVGGYVKLLLHRFPDKLDAAAREYITGAAAGAERMQGLITDLLAFSRVGTQGGAFAPADLNALLSNALNNLQVTITESGAKITSDPLPTLPVDGTQIAQLFQNLIGNAIKFRSARAPEIHVGARQEKERWLFWVRDNGIGIDPQYSERIFQIFQRLHTRKQYPGTGIGLAICKKIVERHGGAIWVESQLAQGSTFYFSIPEFFAKMEHNA